MLNLPTNDSAVFTDLWELVKKRLNTTHTASDAPDDANSLTGACSGLFNRNDRLPGLSEESEGHAWYADWPYDPFEGLRSTAARYLEADSSPSACPTSLMPTAGGSWANSVAGSSPPRTHREDALKFTNVQHAGLAFAIDDQKTGGSERGGIPQSAELVQSTRLAHLEEGAVE